MDLKIEVILIPVTDVDRAKEFYSEKLGFNVDVDHKAGEDFRVVQLTPPGSACSISIGKGITDAEPGSVRRHAHRRQGHRGRACSAQRCRRRRQPRTALRERAADARAGPRTMPTTARTSSSATRMATPGRCKRSAAPPRREACHECRAERRGGVLGAGRAPPP